MLGFLILTSDVKGLQIKKNLKAVSTVNIGTDGLLLIRKQ